jgi:hypothetical protein
MKTIRLIIVTPSCRLNSFFTCLLLSVLLLLGALPLVGQLNKVAGRVINAETKEPVPFANVFFASTTVGGTTAEDGTFSLEGFPDGKYDLSVTHVGYQNYQFALDFSTIHDVRHDILLKEAPINLKEVVVNENSSSTEEFLGYFKRYFIGTTSNAVKCRIINPESLYFYFDKDAKVLVAHADEPIVIENRALGYKVTYHLDMFEYRRNEGLVYAFGIPKFELLQAKNQGEQFKWAARRKEAFAGSVTHFMRSLGKNQLIENGFDVKQVVTIRNKRRPEQSLLDKKIKELRTLKLSGGTNQEQKSDSLDYYTYLHSMPVFIDSIGSKLTGKELFENGSNRTLTYKGKLTVVYKNEKEETAYVDQYNKPKPEHQRSTLHFLEDHLTLYPNGYYENIKSVLVEGYWGWSEKIANLLPTDYELH